MKREIFKGFRKKDPVPCIVTFGDVEMRAADFQSTIDHIQPHELQIESAKRNGIEPVSFDDILKQIQPVDVEFIVLFDSTPSSPGNHWVVSRVDMENKSVEMKLCSSLGGHLYESFDPMSVPFDKTMFTGISIQNNSINGRILTMSEFAEYCKNNEILDGVNWEEKILWSNSKRKLIPSSEHPSFIYK